MNFKGKMREKSGITLITLVVTIIVLLILAGISIATLTADNGILKNATYAKFATEVRDLQEQVNLKVIQEDYSGSGEINEELKIDSKYNDLLYIEEGELVYVSSEASDIEKEWLEDYYYSQNKDREEIDKLIDYYSNRNKISNHY